MASVAEIKTALLADQVAAQKAYELSTSAIGTVSSVASWTITALGVLVAIIAIFGWAVIAKASKAAAKKVAHDNVHAYLKSDEFIRLLDDKVEKALINKSIQGYVSGNDDIDDVDPFPSEPEKGEP